MFAASQNQYVKSVDLQGINLDGSVTVQYGGQTFSRVKSQDTAQRQGSATAIRIGRQLVVLAQGGYYAAKTTA